MRHNYFKISSGLPKDNNPTSSIFVLLVAIVLQL
jgi:hypothetical protein